MYSKALDKREYSFSYFSSKSQVVTPQMRDEGSQRDGSDEGSQHTVFFFGKIKKNYP